MANFTRALAILVFFLSTTLHARLSGGTLLQSQHSVFDGQIARAVFFTLPSAQDW